MVIGDYELLTISVLIKINYFYDRGKFRKLTPHDLAFGIGRKATDEELRELLSRPKTGERIDDMEALEIIKKRLAEMTRRRRYESSSRTCCYSRL